VTGRSHGHGRGGASGRAAGRGRRRRPARRALGVIAAAIVALTAATTPAGAGTDPGLKVVSLDSARYPDVSVIVRAPGEAGRLKPDDIRLREDGDERPVSVKALPGDRIQVVLVIDTSGSMNGVPMMAAKAAATDFVTKLSVGTQVAVVGFGARPSVAMPFTTDRNKLVAAIGGLQSAGETSLYDAIALALAQFPKVKGVSRNLVLLSDGGDTASAATGAEVSALLEKSDVRLDAVSLVTPDTDNRSLEALARAGRGEVTGVDDTAGLTAVYRRIASTLQNQFVVSYRSEGHGATSLEIGLADGSVSPVRTDVELPKAPAAPAQPRTIVHPAPSGALASPWLLVVGAGAFFVVFLMLGIQLTGRRREGPSLRDRVGMARRQPETNPALSELADRATRAADSFLDRKDRRRGLNAALEQAGINLRPGEFVVLAASIATGILALGVLLFGPLPGLLMAAAAAFLARRVVGFVARRRQKAFADQLGDVLQILSGTLRSGYGLLQAVDAVGKETDDPAGDEFRRLVVETRLGRDLADSLHAMAERMDSEDFEWVVQAIDIHREVGGDLAEVLDTVGVTIRERNQLRRQVKALSAEGRFSAYVLLALPIVIIGMVHMTTPDYLNELFSGIGFVLLGLGMILMAVGGIWLKKICTIRF